MGHPADGTRAIALFGGAAIHADGVPLGGRAAHRHPLAILALLVANSGRPITRDKLIALLWPERDADAARNLLKVNVHELRKQLGETAIRSTGDQLSIDVGEISCDVAEFNAAILEGNDARAAALYTGPFLDGLYLKDAADFERWAEGERARLAQRYGEVLERLAMAAHGAGNTQELVRWRRAQMAHDPYHPDVAQRLMEVLAASGDQAGAIGVAEAFGNRRRDDLGIEDDGGLLTLARTLAATYTPTSSAIVAEQASAVSEGRSDAVVQALSARPAAETAPGASGEARHMRQTTRPKAVSRGRAIGATLVVGAIAVVVAANTMMRGHARQAEVGSVTVLPFKVVGADSALGAQEASLLEARLTGGADLGARGRVVSGEIVGSRDSLILSARLGASSDAAPIATARAAAGAGASLADLTDRAAVELMARAAGEPTDRIAGIVARPFAAARRYLLAQSAYKSGRYAAAESLYAQALAADSTFGAAGLGLAMANSWTVINEHYGIGRDAAMSHLSTLSERDRLFALAFFGPDPALGKPLPAPVYLSRWEDLVEKYPDWTEAWYQLGDRYYHFGGLSGLADAEDRALHAFGRAVAQDSAFVAPLHHMVELYAARHQLPELRAAGDRYFAANPAVRRDASSIGWEMAAALGDSAWLQRLRANFDSMPREELARIGWVTEANGWPRSDATRAVALANQKAGTPSEHEKYIILEFALAENAGDATAAHAAAEALGAQFPDRPVGALWDLYGALFGIQDTALAADAVNRLQAFVRAPASGDHVRRDQHHLATCMTGYWSATRGDLAAARHALERVTADLRVEDNNFARRNATVCAAMLDATIATRGHAGSATRAVARLDTILLEQRVPPHVILEAGTLVSARLHAALADTAGALVAARRREHLTGDPIFLSAELEAEAEYAAAAGDRDGAARASAHLAAVRR